MSKCKCTNIDYEWQEMCNEEKRRGVLEAQFDKRCDKGHVIKLGNPSDQEVKKLVGPVYDENGVENWPLYESKYDSMRTRKEYSDAEWNKLSTDEKKEIIKFTWEIIEQNRKLNRIEEIWEKRLDKYADTGKMV